ncbi:PAS domain S-box protein [Methanospirillum stamsii]|uniref:histidine kinase n=1 Tax=Methanospirillum stamsii TaxID=1277351 RepID=A0A2V2N8B0_9EURY|nr:PAS domain S-box protein [Methanospirillum stamsii]PWR74785.1 hypothetical protein DLD82_07775 [Methanospirillum stamsii]
MIRPDPLFNNRQISLLYVDDEEDLLSLGKAFLERTGEFRVDILNSALQAINSSKIPTYDAIISDFQMPEMDGIQFLKAVREKFGDVPFILFTGRGREEVVIEAINNGADFYLQKGGDPKSLFAELSHKVIQAVRSKTIESSLRESNKRLLDFINFLPDATFAINRSGEVIAWNRAIEEMTGVSSQEMLGKGNYEYSIPFYGYRRPILIDLIEEPDEKISEFYTKGSRIGESVIGESNLPHPKGTSIYVLAKACRFFNEEGENIGAIESIRDITEFKKSELKIRESEERFRTMADRSFDVTLILNAEMKPTYISPAVESVIGYKPEELLGKSYSDVLDTVFSPCREDFLSTIQKIMKGEIIEDTEFQICRKDGSLLYVNHYAVPIIKDGVFSGAQASLRVVASRKAIEKALKETEGKFRALIDQSLDGIIIIDFSGNVLFVNPRIGEIIGHPDIEALVGTSNVLSFILPEFHDQVIYDFNQVKNGTDSYLVNYQVKTCDNRTIWIDCAGKKITYGGIPSMLVSIHDVTDRKEAIDALHESDLTLRNIFKDSPIAITLVSATDGKFIQINDAFLKNTGYSREMIIGKNAEEIGIFPDILRYREMVTSYKNNTQVSGFEIPCKIASGEERTCLFSSSLIVVKGNPYILTFIEDITEQKQAEFFHQAIIKSYGIVDEHKSLNAIIETLSAYLKADGVLIGEVLPDNETVRIISSILDGENITDTYYNIKGTPCEHVIKNGFSLYPDNISNLFPDAKNLSDLQIQGYIGAPLPNSEGKVIGILCILFRHPFQVSETFQEILEIIAVRLAVDIERIHIEQTLRKNQAVLSEAMNLAKLAKWEYDVDTGLFLFNENFYQLYGTTSEREGGNLMSAEKYAKDFLHPADLSLVSQEIYKAIEAKDPGYTSHLEHRIIRRDGEVRYISVRIAIIKDKSGRTIKTHGVNQDITERRKSEEAIRKANNQLNLLSSITRHDILNKITGIRGYLAVMEMENSDQKLNEYLHRTRTATDVIQSHIEFTRVYQKIGSHEPQWIDLQSVMPSAHLPESISMILDIRHVILYADPLLERVFFNLLDNSIRHGKHTTTIHVSGFKADSGFTVLWEDDGIGIEDTEKEKIFERGYGQNTGLGMFLVREILSLTDITIKETGVFQKGARFEITVPKGSYQIVNSDGNRINS